jgi:hypothetical protein
LDTIAAIRKLYPKRPLTFYERNLVKTGDGNGISIGQFYAAMQRRNISERMATMFENAYKNELMARRVTHDALSTLPEIKDTFRTLILLMDNGQPIDDLTKQHIVLHHQLLTEGSDEEVELREARRLQEQARLEAMLVDEDEKVAHRPQVELDLSVNLDD